MKPPVTVFVDDDRSFNRDAYEIVQGAQTAAVDKPFLVNLRVRSSGLPYDLTAVTAMTCCFQNDDGTDLILTLGSGLSVSGSAVLGQLLVTITAAQTALLALVDNATLTLRLTKTGDPFPLVIENAYSVVPNGC